MQTETLAVAAETIFGSQTELGWVISVSAVAIWRLASQNLTHAAFGLRRERPIEIRIDAANRFDWVIADLGIVEIANAVGGNSLPRCGEIFKCLRPVLDRVASDLNRIDGFG